MSRFNPNNHLTKIQGREYLPVAARLIWFREEHPDWGIETKPLKISFEQNFAVFQASIVNAEGKVMATATKMENVKGFPDWLEKAETGSVGRALALCGYGTQFAPEFDEGEKRLADAPVAPAPAAKQRPDVRHAQDFEDEKPLPQAGSQPPPRHERGTKPSTTLEAQRDWARGKFYAAAEQQGVKPADEAEEAALINGLLGRDGERARKRPTPEEYQQATAILLRGDEKTAEIDEEAEIL
jgi:hypothetical protein